MGEKWSEERINAYKRYIKADTIDLELWERALKRHEKGVVSAKHMIESKKQDIVKSTEELAKQGVFL